ncbi:hypothetical protein [Methylomonas albis]|uniref:Lipoprotein n=1 Tax=Methylomonas albis TaxID=1854563 RepID=A0ABR9CY20_9GAMM|nr:hypothetical protein [Methylomonas albis]MBD9355797.1 hypothetical protein [Methylomonas albis]CAD6878820.1 hypothetical protein [Methylomonas albis]
MGRIKALTCWSLVLVMCGACSADWPQRLGYHAVQNAGQLQCQKAMANDCERRQSYDEYQRERERMQ